MKWFGQWFYKEARGLVLSFLALVPSSTVVETGSCETVSLFSAYVASILLLLFLHSLALLTRLWGLPAVLAVDLFADRPRCVLPQVLGLCMSSTSSILDSSAGLTPFLRLSQMGAWLPVSARARGRQPWELRTPARKSLVFKSLFMKLSTSFLLPLPCLIFCCIIFCFIFLFSATFPPP